MSSLTLWHTPSHLAGRSLLPEPTIPNGNWDTWIGELAHQSSILSRSVPHCMSSPACSLLTLSLPIDGKPMLNNENELIFKAELNARIANSELRHVEPYRGPGGTCLPNPSVFPFRKPMSSNVSNRSKVPCGLESVVSITNTGADFLNSVRRRSIAKTSSLRRVRESVEGDGTRRRLC